MDSASPDTTASETSPLSGITTPEIQDRLAAAAHESYEALQEAVAAIKKEAGEAVLQRQIESRTALGHCMAALAESLPQAKEIALQHEMDTLMEAIDAFADQYPETPSKIKVALTHPSIPRSLLEHKPDTLELCFKRLHEKLPEHMLNFAGLLLSAIAKQSMAGLTSQTGKDVHQRMNLSAFDTLRPEHTEGLGLEWNAGTLELIGNEFGNNIGRETTGGRIHIEAKRIGNHVGIHMSGGTVIVDVRALGHSAFAHMTGGEATVTAETIDDDLGAHISAGASLTASANSIGPGACHNMQGGNVNLRGGRIGEQLGRGMSRGSLRVTGTAKDFRNGASGGGGTLTGQVADAARGQIDGTTIIRGSASGSVGFRMTGGTVEVDNVTGGDLGEEMQGGEIACSTAHNARIGRNANRGKISVGTAALSRIGGGESTSAHITIGTKDKYCHVPPGNGTVKIGGGRPIFNVFRR